MSERDGGRRGRERNGTKDESEGGREVEFPLASVTQAP